MSVPTSYRIGFVEHKIQGLMLNNPSFLRLQQDQQGRRFSITFILFISGYESIVGIHMYLTRH